MQTSTRDLDLEFEGYLAFLEQQDQEDQEDQSYYYQYATYLAPFDTPQFGQQLQLEQLQGDARDGQTASFKEATTQTEPQLNPQVPSNVSSTDTTVRQSPAQQKLSQVDGGDRSAGSTARQQLSTQRHPQLNNKGPQSQPMLRDAGYLQTATRSQPRVQQASLSLEKRSGNNARGTRTTGGQLGAAQHQKQLGRAASSYTRSIGATFGQSLVQKQSKLDKQGSSSDNPIVITHEEPSAPRQQQLLDRRATRNIHLPSATPKPPPAQPNRTERREASDDQNADTQKRLSSTPQRQQGQLKRKQDRKSVV